MNIINSKFSKNVRDTLFKSFKNLKQDPSSSSQVKRDARENLSSGFGGSSDLEGGEEPFIESSNPIKMIPFLEYIICNEPDKLDESIYNSLLDCYLLVLRKETDVEGRNIFRNKAMSLLKDGLGKYSSEQAMISCRMNHFMDGLLFLFEQRQLYDLILDHYIQVNESDKIVETCVRFCEEDERLWVRAFWYFSKSSQQETDHLQRVLEEVDKRNLLPPISVIEILSRKCPSARLPAIRDYLVRWLTKTSETIAKNNDSIAQYQDATDQMRDEIESIRTQPKVFQSSRCSSCKMHLELPSVHFLCGHSYHQACLETPIDPEASSTNPFSETEGCPLCIPDQINLLSSLMSSHEVKDSDSSKLK